MSIEMENPATVYEKIDAAANLIEQMFMSHRIKDEAHFLKSHARAGQLLFEAMRQIDEEEGEDSHLSSEDYATGPVAGGIPEQGIR